MRTGALLLIAGAMSACRREPPPPENLPPPSPPATPSASAWTAPATPDWPELPTTAEARASLISRSTITAPRADAGADRTIDAVIDAAAHRGWSRTIAGDDAIRSTLERWLERVEHEGRAAYVLFGTMHDSGAHVEAFRRLIGPGGVRGLTHVVLESFRADGAWGGLAPIEQRGDGASMAAWMANGDAPTFDALTRFHAEHDYASWKFGYADRVMDLLVAGRASGTPVLPCDMPPTLQAKVTGARPSDELDRIRELHCMFAMRDAVLRTPRFEGKPRVAMLWGAAHVRADALPRFLPAEAAVITITVFGRRPGHDAPDRVIGDRVVVNDPLLVSLDDDGRERALLLPDVAVDVDRVWRHEPIEGSDSYVRVRADVASRIAIDDQPPQTVGAGVTSIKIAPGFHTYALDVGDGKKRVTIVGSVDIPALGAAELTFEGALDPKKRWTRVEYVSAK